jgi:hypothetical protein
VIVVESPEESDKSPSDAKPSDAKPLYLELKCCPYVDRVTDAVAKALTCSEYDDIIVKAREMLGNKTRKRVFFLCCAKKDAQPYQNSYPYKIYCHENVKVEDTGKEIGYKLAEGKDDDQSIRQNAQFIAFMYEWLLDIIKKNTESIKVLVICSGGINRSPRVALLLSLLIENGTDYTKVWGGYMKYFEQNKDWAKQKWDSIWEQVFNQTVSFSFCLFL